MAAGLDQGRRNLLLACAAMTAAVSAPLARTHDAVLPAPRSLADELAKALRIGQPLVVMISLANCPFCRMARNNYLEPLRREEGLPVFQVDMRSEVPVLDFQRVATTHDHLVRDWSVKVAPSVLFFGARGREVAERLQGAYIEDFYGAYLEQRLQQARIALKG